MQNVNKVIILGNLGTEPQVGFAKSGKQYTRLSVATNLYYNEDGQKKKKTDWHCVFVWGSNGERCAKHLQKGSPVFVEGYISQYQSDGGEGTKEYKSSITAKQVSFIGGLTSPGKDDL